MNCESAAELIASWWLSEVPPEEDAQVRQHLQTCSACAAVHAAWLQLPELAAPEPSYAMHARWRQTLAREIRPQPNVNWWMAAACLVIGLALGALATRPANRSEVAKLRAEVANTRELVALSMLQQQSATERLRGVDYSRQLPALEPGVVSALIRAVQHDANVNVRLAAVEALASVSRDAGVRRTLAASISREQSPLVQSALIDYVVEARDPGAGEALRGVAQRPDIYPAIRQRAEAAARQLTRYR